jgi:hypothetical protein
MFENVDSCWREHLARDRKESSQMLNEKNNIRSLKFSLLKVCYQSGKLEGK